MNKSLIFAFVLLGCAFVYADVVELTADNFADKTSEGVWFVKLYVNFGFVKYFLQVSNILPQLCTMVWTL